MGNLWPSGFAEGLQSSFGEYYECLNIKSPSVQAINGQYCLLKVILPLPPTDSYSEGEPILEEFDFISSLTNSFNLHKLSSVKHMIERLNHSNGTLYNLGICIPSVCTAREFEDLLNKGMLKKLI